MEFEYAKTLTNIKTVPKAQDPAETVTADILYRVAKAELLKTMESDQAKAWAARITAGFLRMTK